MKGKVCRDKREFAAYLPVEVARFLHAPLATLRGWAAGRSYRTAAGMRRVEPLIESAEQRPITLSFSNLVEAYVLAALTRAGHRPLRSVRDDLRRLRKISKTRHPLAERTFLADSHSVLVRDKGWLIPTSGYRPAASTSGLSTWLSRIEWDEEGVARGLYPFVGPIVRGAPRSVVIDPLVAFGRPILVGISVPTQVVGERFRAGEAPRALARDSDLPVGQILEALRCERARAA